MGTIHLSPAWLSATLLTLPFKIPPCVDALPQHEMLCSRCLEPTGGPAYAHLHPSQGEVPTVKEGGNNALPIQMYQQNTHKAVHEDSVAEAAPFTSRVVQLTCLQITR
jgi:hypothetical protein